MILAGVGQPVGAGPQVLTVTAKSVSVISHLLVKPDANCAPPGRIFEYGINPMHPPSSHTLANHTTNNHGNLGL